ncbi:hypothetical protein HDU96_002903 [Phlyctochytrium bullatum]|nr:hypothetical protein HDU96_002903 [Phlyctochytrium bullatum]
MFKDKRNYVFLSKNITTKDEWETAKKDFEGKCERKFEHWIDGDLVKDEGKIAKCRASWKYTEPYIGIFAHSYPEVKIIWDKVVDKKKCYVGLSWCSTLYDTFTGVGSRPHLQRCFTDIWAKENKCKQQLQAKNPKKNKPFSDSYEPFKLAFDKNITELLW